MSAPCSLSATLSGEKKKAKFHLAAPKVTVPPRHAQSCVLLACSISWFFALSTYRGISVNFLLKVVWMCLRGQIISVVLPGLSAKLAFSLGLLLLSCLAVKMSEIRESTVNALAKLKTFDKCSHFQASFDTHDMFVSCRAKEGRPECTREDNCVACVS